MKLFRNNLESGYLNIFVMFTLIICIFIFYLSIVLTIPYNSDHASILLEAKSIVDGNIFLKGWNLSTVSFIIIKLSCFIFRLINLARGGVR